MCVCVCVSSLLRYCLNIFLFPLPKVGCPQFLEIRNPWRIIVKNSNLRPLLLLPLHEKQFVFGRILPYWAGLFWNWCFSLPLTVFFFPTSLSPMSELFRFLESLEKSNGKKWSQIWKLLLIKGVKWSRQKKCFTTPPPPILRNFQKKAKKNYPKTFGFGFEPLPPLDNVYRSAAFFSGFLPYVYLLSG